jgi:hypothetical protein
MHLKTGDDIYIIINMTKIYKAFLTDKVVIKLFILYYLLK